VVGSFNLKPTLSLAQNMGTEGGAQAKCRLPSTRARSTRYDPLYPKKLRDRSH
jgi:hypothetical protein